MYDYSLNQMQSKNSSHVQQIFGKRFLSDHALFDISYVFIGWRPVKALAKKKAFFCYQ
jgi:hypothetical protein